MSSRSAIESNCARVVVVHTRWDERWMMRDADCSSHRDVNIHPRTSQLLVQSQVVLPRQDNGRHAVPSTYVRLSAVLRIQLETVKPLSVRCHGWLIDVTDVRYLGRVPFTRWRACVVVDHISSDLRQHRLLDVQSAERLCPIHDVPRVDDDDVTRVSVARSAHWCRMLPWGTAAAAVTWPFTLQHR